MVCVVSLLALHSSACDRRLMARASVDSLGWGVALALPIVMVMSPCSGWEVAPALPIVMSPCLGWVAVLVRPIVSVCSGWVLVLVRPMMTNHCPCLCLGLEVVLARPTAPMSLLLAFGSGLRSMSVLILPPLFPLLSPPWPLGRDCLGQVTALVGSVWVERVGLVVLVEVVVGEEVGSVVLVVVGVEEEIDLVVLVVVGVCRGCHSSVGVPKRTFPHLSMVLSLVLASCLGGALEVRLLTSWYWWYWWLWYWYWRW